VQQLDAYVGDLIEAVGCGVLPNGTHHPASLAGWLLQFQANTARGCGCSDH